MLRIYFGDMQGAIYNTAVYFKNTYDEDWIMQPMVKAIIKDIDKSEVLDKALIQSPVLGKIPPLMLSGGTKTLILIANDKSKVFNVSTCGDNCAKWLLKMAEKEDITVNLRHLMNFGNGPFDIYVINNGITVHNMDQLLDAAAEYI